MRITVTVVVIMFELTGALTYILPTMVKLYALNPLQPILNPLIDCPVSHESSRRLLGDYRNCGRGDTLQRIPLPRQGRPCL